MSLTKEIPKAITKTLTRIEQYEQRLEKLQEHDCLCEFCGIEEAVISLGEQLAEQEKELKRLKTYAKEHQIKI